MTTQILLELWKEARSRFSNQLNSITEHDLTKKIQSTNNSIGFLIRHIGDVELLFAKNVFGDKEVKVSAITLIDGKDSGNWTNLKELIDYVNFSFKILLKIIENQKDEEWNTVISTKEFGSKTKAEAFGRIISHTTYHAGQIALIQKYS